MYYQPATGRVIAGHSEARSALPNVIFPAILDNEMLGYHGIFPLVSVKPDIPPGQIAEGFGVELVDGLWTQLWVVRDATPQELEQLKPVVPQQVTMRQARLALLGAGVLDQVAGAIAELESPHRETAQIEWEFSSTVDRGRPLVAMLGPKLGLTDEQLDQLFITAAGL